MLSAGLLTALGILFLLYKVGFKRVLAYDVIVDIVATLGLMTIFAGTYAGMMAAIVGGLFISVVLIIAKKLFGYEKLTCLWIPFTYKNIPLVRPRFIWTPVN
mgnify:CR=1|jgi:hypothetical protein|tara:strand:- start:175 stop:480 length:306 start_codon:yes stop_codon:yes gene_type:complete